MAVAFIYGLEEGVVEVLTSFKPHKRVLMPTSDYVKIQTNEGSIMEGIFGEGFWTFNLLHQQDITVQEMAMCHPLVPGDKSEGLFLYGNFNSINFLEHDTN